MDSSPEESSHPVVREVCIALALVSIWSSATCGARAHRLARSARHALRDQSKGSGSSASCIVIGRSLVAGLSRSARPRRSCEQGREAVSPPRGSIPARCVAAGGSSPSGGRHRDGSAGPRAIPRGGRSAPFDAVLRYAGLWPCQTVDKSTPLALSPPILDEELLGMGAPFVHDLADAFRMIGTCRSWTVDGGQPNAPRGSDRKGVRCRGLT